MTKEPKKLFSFFYSAKTLYIGLPVIAVAIFFLLYNFIPLPDISDGYLPDEVRKVTYNAPLTVHFSQPMNKLSVEANFSVNPKLDGEFKWIDYKTLEYIPKTALNINDEYRVTIGAKAKSLYLKSMGADFVLRFVVTGPPYVKFISPYPYTDKTKGEKPQWMEENPVEGLIEGPVEGLIEGQVDGTIDTSGAENSGDTESVSALKEPELIIIPKDQNITVMFDRPMRELTTIDESASNQNIPELEITPSVKGSYRWLGTTAFQFIPDEWVMGTTYTIKLPKGITALDGGQTEEETVWQLATDSPKIVSSSPSSAYDAFGVNDNITLVFNQPMDLDYIKPGNNVLLYPSNDTDAEKNPKQDGFFNTEVVFGKTEDGKTDNKILVFKPEFPYLYDHFYKLVIKSGLEGAAYKQGGGYGDRFMEEDVTINFRTTKKPDIVSYKPANGDQNYGENYITIDFASPMTKELIAGLYSINPKPDKEPDVSVYQINDATKGNLWEANIIYDLEPSKNYTFEFKEPFKDTFGNTSSKGFKTSFKTAPKKPFLSLLIQDSFGLFMNGLGPIYTIKSININTVDVKYCALSEQEFFEVNKKYGWYQYHCPDPERKTIDVKSKLNSVNFFDIDLRDVFDKEFDNGGYFFEVSSRQYTNENKEPVRFYQTFFVSDTNLTLKKSGQDLLVWATDLKTGKPVPRMDLKIISYQGKELQSGVTDGNGLYKITKEFSDNIYVIGTKAFENENRWSMVSQYWSNGIQTWEYGLNGEWVGLNEPRIYIYTERPLYRPGDEIFYKGIYRMDNDAKLTLPADKKVRVAIEDPEYNEINSEEIKLLSDGSFSGSFKLAENARLGQYNLYAETTGQKYPQRFYTYFFIEEYKKPKFKVEVLGSETDYIQGDSVSMDVIANYYFGGAIQGGKVTWTLMREPYIFTKYKGEDYYSFGVWRGFECYWGYCSSATEISAEGEDVLDQNGKLHLSIPEDEKAEKGQSYMYTLNAMITNKDGETVSKRESFIVHQGTYYIGLSLKNYIVEPGNKLQLKVITVSSTDAKIVSDKKISLELYQEKWNTVKKQGVDGNFYDESVRELVFVKKQSVTSSSEPVEAEIDLDKNMEGGSYVIQAKASEGGNEILSEANFYVSSTEWVNWGSFNNSRMELVPDQPEYIVGGKANVLIKSPYGTEKEPVKALVTYERAGIQHYEIIDIKSNSDTIEIPITENMAPNVYVSVMLIKGTGENFDAFVANDSKERLLARQKSLSSDISKLESEISDLKSSTDESASNRNKILISKKELELTALKKELDDVNGTLDKAKNMTSDTIDYSLIKPDFKLGIVNLPVNIREHKIFIDLKTTKPSYEVGEKATIEIHTLDYQNRPIPANVSLAVVDESLLALVANQKVDPLNYFFGQRALQVSTSASLTLHMDRANIKSQQGAKGGDGGGSELFEKKRGEFKDTAYFNPLVKTDAGGYAKIEFEPPDNLTTWQIWAVASAKEDDFGMATQDFVVKKPLAVTSILPRFVISGDSLTIGALVHNQSGKDLETTISVKATGLTIKGSAKKSLFIRNGGSERADFQAETDPINFDTNASVEFSTSDGNKLSDTVVYTLPVKTFAYPEVVAINGTVDATQTEKIRIPKDIEPDMGGLDIKVGGSILTKFIKQFKALADYPYGCAEQITSQILPTLVLFNQSLKNTETDLFKLINSDKEKSKKIIEKVLQTLSKFQQFDGGYGFWEGDSYSNPILTSYILYSQRLASLSGFTVSDNSFDLAVQYLWQRLNSKDDRYKLTSDERAFILWVLSEAEQNDTGMTLSLFEKRDEMSLYAQGLMLMNLENLVNAGQKSVEPFIEKLKSEIVSKQISEDRTVHFEEVSNSWWDLNTNRRTNAIILMALNRDDPENPILPNLVNYFVSTKDQSYMINTQETAWVLMSMLEYAQSQEILNADFSFSAIVNSKELIKGAINSKNLEQIFEKELALNQLLSAENINEITFQKDGKGQMNYDMELKYYLPNEVIWPMEKGFFVSRNYYEFNTTEKSKVAKDIKSGEIYRGELNIIVPEDMYYVVVEERLPAGFEAINFNLQTTDASLQYKLEQQTKPKEGESYWYDNPLWYFNHTEMRDDRVLLFADYLPRGVYTYNFLVRAGLPGKYHHLPASAYEMYFPEVFGRTGGEWVEVKE